MKEVDKIIYNKDKNEEDFYLNNIQNLLKQLKSLSCYIIEVNKL